MALDFMVKSLAVKNEDAKEEHKATTIAFKWDTETVKLVKPLTFMNLSGESVCSLARFYKVPLENILVIHDDMDQPFGQIRIKTKSGDGGHNGIKSLIETFGTNDILRVKIGIGRSPIAAMDPADWVLQKFSSEEQTNLTEVLDKAVDAVESIVFDGPTVAMNIFNVKK
jgi:PTH1 family peptidyl-tRNA hydrolase